MALILIGNLASPHLRSWVRVLASKQKIVIFDINRNEKSLIDPRLAEIHKPLPRFLTGRHKTLQYILLGIWLRFFCKANLIHAHNTSGYGLSAWLSGKRFIVTTYGTEIYQSRSRGIAFHWMIGSVVKAASLLTASTRYMADYLSQEFQVPPDRIFCKTLLDQKFVEAATFPPRGGTRVWIVNRRMTKLYGTLEIVEAFKRFVAAGGVGKLILIEGDSDHSYAAHVAIAVKGHESIEIIPGFIAQSRMIALLKAAHFCVSVPESDQLSSAILEGAACGAIPIVRSLESYEPVDPISIKIDRSVNWSDALLAMFRETSSLPNETVTKLSSEARDFVLNNFSPESYIREFESKLNGIS